MDPIKRLTPRRLAMFGLLAVAVVVALNATSSGIGAAAAAVFAIVFVVLRIVLPFVYSERRRRDDEAERDLVRRAQQGDDAALEQLHDRYARLATAIATGHAEQAHAALDARLHRFDPDGDVSFGAFVVAVFRTTRTDR